MPERSSPFRIGLIGAGIIGADHIRAAEGSAHYRIAAVADPRADAAGLVPSGTALFADHREMLAQSRLDAVIVAAPHALHLGIVQDAARAGVHVLVEKPMAVTVDEARRMIDACEKAGILLAVAHVLHFDPVAREARRIIASRSFGSPVMITHRRAAHYDAGSRPAWFFDPAIAGGGIVINVGTHGFDRIQWLTGSRIREVSGTTIGRPGYSVETDAMAIARLEDGTPASISLLSRGVPYFDETEIALTTATLRLSAQEGLFLLRDGRTEHLLEPSPDGHITALRTQLDGFVSAAQGQGGEYVDGSYGTSVVAAARALYASAAAGDLRSVSLAADRPDLPH